MAVRNVSITCPNAKSGSWSGNWFMSAPYHSLTVSLPSGWQDAAKCEVKWEVMSGDLPCCPPLYSRRRLHTPSPPSCRHQGKDNSLSRWLVERNLASEP